MPVAPGKGPPSGIRSSDLWTKLNARPRPSVVVPFPGDESLGGVRIQILTEQERHQCLADAAAEARRRIKKATEDPDAARTGDIGYEDLYRQESALQLVFMACRDENDIQFPAFQTVERARAKLTTDEIGALLAAYNAFRRESGPVLAEMTTPEMDAWVRVLQEGASRVPLAQLSSEALSDLVMHLIARLGTSSTDNGSSGSPPESSAPESQTPSPSDE